MAQRQIPPLPASPGIRPQRLALLMCAHVDDGPTGTPPRCWPRRAWQALLTSCQHRCPADSAGAWRWWHAFARPRILTVLDEPEQCLDWAGRR